MAPLGASDAAGADAVITIEAGPPIDASGTGTVYVPQNPYLASESPSLEVELGSFIEPVLSRWPVVRTVGACAIHQITYSNTPSAMRPSAGTITLSDTTTGWSIHADVDMAGHYDAPGGGPALQTGEPVQVRAVGGAIPAFTTTMPFPPRISLVTPAGIAPSDEIMINRSAGLDLAWTTESGAGETPILVTIYQSFTSLDRTLTFGTGIECHYASHGGVGTATIPAEVLGVLAVVGAGVGPAEIDIGTEATTTVMPGAFSIDVVFHRNAIANQVTIE